ncbi:flagellar hook capping FlgD N-terminal domain-containing protein [Conexibacter arvalis]|uniref:Flagellar basal-body rod modification protein FlgD n=1 Tax=Conexibacter arvalis TaxID=912552 RepID=A0A840I9U0_9ACTN|nr:flagellar hook capping FlgD N-terminal domain-containing protein [Conexibacter arvalis]MBB4661003.1 flagellar basal-body rod modification protein FlgD [Conexibacter arvalis]
MPVDPANSSTRAPSVYDTTRPKDPSILGKDDFLKLLIGQMQNQDPLNPTDGAQYMAQMTQFSILEQITNLGQTMAAASSNEYDQNAIALIGKQISYLRLDGRELRTYTGTVESVTFTNQGPQLTIREDSAKVMPVSVTAVWGPDGPPPPTDPPPTDPPPGGDDEGGEAEGDVGASGTSGV